MALTDEQKQPIREEEIERLRVCREIGGDRFQHDWNRLAVRKTFIFWGVLIAFAVLLWSVVKSYHNR